jgi:acyl-CoA synthetase (AMP-forming)/AMP-acid ligase II
VHEARLNVGFITAFARQYRRDLEQAFVLQGKGEASSSGGYNVYPREIEMALESHPAVALAAVVGVPDPVWQEVGGAYVTLERAAEPDALLAWCRERVANYKAPKRLEVLPAMPLLPIGKIDKSALRRRACGSEDGPDR